MNDDAGALDYRALLEFRTGLRRFLRWSEAQAAEAGLTPAHHQLLLAIRGHRADAPTIGDVAEVLLLRHHSAVELVARAARSGLVNRHDDPDDHRVVRLRLTADGQARLDRLSTLHRDELRRLRPRLRPIWDGL